MAFEAYHTARKRLTGEPVDEFSSIVQLRPEAGRFPMIPVLLILLGGLFLMSNLGLVRLEEIMRFWPAGLILLGAWMLYERLRPAPKPAKAEGPETPADGGGAL
jgi:hypothetical protein